MCECVCVTDQAGVKQGTTPAAYFQETEGFRRYEPLEHQAVWRRSGRLTCPSHRACEDQLPWRTRTWTCGTPRGWDATSGKGERSKDFVHWGNQGISSTYRASMNDVLQRPPRARTHEPRAGCTSRMRSTTPRGRKSSGRHRGGSGQTEQPFPRCGWPCVLRRSDCRTPWST